MFPVSGGWGIKGTFSPEGNIIRTRHGRKAIVTGSSMLEIEHCSPWINK